MHEANLYFKKIIIIIIIILAILALHLSKLLQTKPQHFHHHHFLRHCCKLLLVSAVFLHVVDRIGRSNFMPFDFFGHKRGIGTVVVLRYETFPCVVSNSILLNFFRRKYRKQIPKREKNN